MEDLISRKEAIKAIKDLSDCPNGFSDTYDKERIINTLENVPSVGSSGIHAKLKTIQVVDRDVGKCSSCGALIDISWIDDVPVRYCRWCGARFDER